MATAFQATAFQNNAFQIDAAVVDAPGSTILQRRKVDLVGVTRKRYQDYRKQWRIDAINAQRELKRKKRKEVDEPLGYAKIEYDKYKFDVARGEAAFHELLLNLEHQQAQRAQIQAQLFAKDAMARISAAQALARKAAMDERVAQMHQFSRDAAEEEEALELLMMEDDD
jgi:hypothetical protein